MPHTPENKKNTVDISKATPEDIEKLTTERMIKGFEDHEKNKQQQIKGQITGKFKDHDIITAVSKGEDGDAALFTALFKNKYIYDHAANQWYYWNDHFWRIDKINQVQASIQDVIAEYWIVRDRADWNYTKAVKKQDTDKSSEYKKIRDSIHARIKELHSLRRKKNILSLSTSGVDSLGIPGEDWDTNPMLLGCRNGCVDLTTGEFHPGEPTDYIKTVSPIKWESLNAPCPMWENFLWEIFNCNYDIVDCIHRLFGYGITGLTTEHVYPILWGSRGRNGKGTMLEAIKYVLGDLAYKAPTDFLMQSGPNKSNSAPDAELMALRGARLVWCSETNEGDRLNVAKLKELSGGDTISARPPYGKRQIQFEPTHLLLLLTNKCPKVPANDLAVWRRILLFPFELSFVDNPVEIYERKADKDLSKKLRSEASGILAWLVRGCLEWQKQGLNPPTIINDATKSYRSDEDIVGHFIAECCILDPAFKVKPKDLYEAYVKWCSEVGHHSMAKKRFNDDMKERFELKKNYELLFYGIELNLI